ncbi:MAG: membrane protein insertase YidC, partial [Desulfuromonas sp.]
DMSQNVLKDEILSDIETEKNNFKISDTTASLRNIEVDTDLYHAVFTTSGARLLSFQLKKYNSTSDPDSPVVQLYSEDLLNYSTLRTSGTESLYIPEDVVFSSDSEQIISLSGNKSKSLIFRAELPSGLQIRKIFTFNGNTYTLDSQIEIINKSSSLMRGTIDYALIKRWDKEKDKDPYSFTGPATLVNEKLEEVSVDDLEESPVSYGVEAKWTSFQTKYFLSVIVPQDESVKRIRILAEGDQVENIVESPHFELAAGQKRLLEYLLYIGPKDFELLKSSGHQLERAVDFGFFGVLSKPLFHVLVFFYGFLNNYGLAIIVLTVIIKLLFWPLTHKSYASMKAMQKLQPEMQKIRERFKDDKERLNRELMELYKKHRVNPLGGCLPMLVQIPVFFALYKVLLGSIALRHAPFVWWLTDLSAKDPYYITPLLMGVSMFVQQKMTPTTADPMQARIFMMMPIIFTFMFLNFPSGLVIYWLVNNLLTIVQQFYIHKKA